MNDYLRVNKGWITCRWCNRQGYPDDHRLCVVGHQKNQQVLLFLSAPYASDPMHNTRTVIQIAETLIAAGYLVYVPHLCHLWQMISPHPESYFLNMSLAWLQQCDAVVRIPGNSPGCETELIASIAKDKPILTVTEALGLVQAMAPDNG